MSIESVTSETSVGTVNLSRTGFGRHAILGEHDAFPERYRLYESPDELLQDFSEDSAEYRAGRKALIQEPSVSDVAILRRDASANVAQIDTGVIDDASLADGDPLGVEFERRTLEITYDQGGGSPDADEAAQQMVDAINAEDWPVTAATTGTLGEYDVTSDFPGQPFEMSDTEGHTSFTTSTSNTPSSETVTDALDAVTDVFDDWYILTLVSQQDTDIQDAADWAEGKRKKFVARSNASDINGSGSTDIASNIKDLSYGNGFLFYHTRPWYFPDAAVVSDRLGKDIDESSPTWDGVELVGVPIETKDDISTTQRNNLKSKNVTYYRDEGGVGETEGGKVWDGEWMDVEVGQDWFNTRLEEKVASLKHAKVNGPDGKLSFTNEGLTAIEGEIRQQFQDGYDNEFLNQERDADKVIDVQDAENYTSTERDSRVADAIEWRHYMAGAIHDAEISGVLIP